MYNVINYNQFLFKNDEIWIKCIFYLPKYVPKKWSFYYQFTNLIMAFILPELCVFTYHSLVYLKWYKLTAFFIIWLIGIAISSIHLFKSRAVEFSFGKETYYDCRELWNEEGGKKLTLFIFIVIFVLPISTLIINWLVYFKTWNSW